VDIFPGEIKQKSAWGLPWTLYSFLNKKPDDFFSLCHYKKSIIKLIYVDTFYAEKKLLGTLFGRPIYFWELPLGFQVGIRNKFRELGDLYPIIRLQGSAFGRPVSYKHWCEEKLCVWLCVLAIFFGFWVFQLHQARELFEKTTLLQARASSKQISSKEAGESLMALADLEKLPLLLLVFEWGPKHIRVGGYLEKTELPNVDKQIQKWWPNRDFRMVTRDQDGGEIAYGEWVSD